MKFKGTKGVWHIEERDNWIDVLSDKDERIVSVDKEDYLFAQSDAKLIASAPELLEMLNKVNNFILANKDKKYMVEILNREVPDLNTLLKQATT